MVKYNKHKTYRQKALPLVPEFIPNLKKRQRDTNDNDYQNKKQKIEHTCLFTRVDSVLDTRIKNEVKQWKCKQFFSDGTIQLHGYINESDAKKLIHPQTQYNIAWRSNIVYHNGLAGYWVVYKGFERYGNKFISRSEITNKNKI